MEVRVLHIFYKMNRGGAESYIMNIYRCINRSSIQFDFIVQTKEVGAYDNEIKSLGGQIHFIPALKWYNAISFIIKWFVFFKKNSDYKIIHAHAQGTASIILSIAKCFNRITIIHSHSSIWGKNIVEAGLKKLVQWPLRYITNYRFACSSIAGKALFGSRSFELKDNAIIVENFQFNQLTRTKKRKEFNLNDEILIGHVGNFTFPKNHMFIIDIFYQLNKKSSKFKLLLVGSGKDEDMVKAKVNSLKLNDFVIFAGARNDVNELLQAIDIFIFPSLFEGLPVTVIEAQAASLPCVISKNITTECALSNLVTFLPIDDSSSVLWVDFIYNNHCKSTNRNTEINLFSKRYNAKNEAIQYEMFYENLIK